MAFTDVLQNGIASVTGSIAKGYFKVRDNRPQAKQDVNLQESQKVSGNGVSSSALGNLGNVSNLKNQVQQVQQKVKTVGTQTIAGKLANLTGINKLTTDDDYDCVFELQFNPNSIQIQSRAGDDDVRKNNYNPNGKSQLSMGSMEKHIEMSVTFIFDQVVNRMAFAQDNLTILSANKVLGDAIEAVKSVALNAIGGGNNVSVQQTVEAFIAALRNKYLRKCCFEWGDMYYEGFLRNVNGRYTMFDFLGRPVRAEVTVTIYLEDEHIDESNLGVWDDAYFKVFGGGSTSFVKTAQKVGNLLNL